MQTARAILKLVRPDSSLFIPLMVFIPLFVRTRQLSFSLSQAVPLFFIGTCTFIANGLDDIERDRINHPERPLPTGQIKPSLAAVLYFASLASALITTKFYVEPNIAFWYYSLFMLSTSYGYVVECFPGFKSIYVASATTVPILVVATSYCETVRRLYLVAGSVFCFVLGKELCMDLVDRAGDPISFLRRIEPRPLAVSAFFLQAVGLLLLALQADDLFAIVDLLLISFLFSTSSFHWFSMANPKRAILIMKAQLLLGLYFLA